FQVPLLEGDRAIGRPVLGLGLLVQPQAAAREHGGTGGDGGDPSCAHGLSPSSRDMTGTEAVWIRRSHQGGRRVTNGALVSRTARLVGGPDRGFRSLMALTVVPAFWARVFSGVAGRATISENA